MNITKEQALKTIEELRKYIEDLDNSKINSFKIGDVYKTDIGYKISILSYGYNSNRYSFGGLNGDLFSMFSDGNKSKGMTFEDVLEKLKNHKAKKIGTLKFVAE